MGLDKNLNIISSFEKEIFNKTFDLSIEYGEIAIDIITTSEVLKAIPGLKTIATFYDITSSINSRYNFKKILVFLQQFHSQKINIDALKKFQIKISNDPKYRQELLETTLILIEQFTDLEKSRILANLLVAHINEDLTWNDYCTIIFIVNQLNPSGYISLIKHCNKKVQIPTGMREYIEGGIFFNSLWHRK